MFDRYGYAKDMDMYAGYGYGQYAYNTKPTFESCPNGGAWMMDARGGLCLQNAARDFNGRFLANSERKYLVHLESGTLTCTHHTHTHDKHTFYIHSYSYMTYMSCTAQVIRYGKLFIAIHCIQRCILIHRFIDRA